MNKKLIRLTESDLHRIVKESVNRVLNEIGDTPRGQNRLGALAKRKQECWKTFDNDYDGHSYNGIFKKYAFRKRNRAVYSDSQRQKLDNHFNKGLNN